MTLESLMTIGLMLNILVILLIPDCSEWSLIYRLRWYKFKEKGIHIKFIFYFILLFTQAFLYKYYFNY